MPQPLLALPVLFLFLSDDGRKLILLLSGSVMLPITLSGLFRLLLKVLKELVISRGDQIEAAWLAIALNKFLEVEQDLSLVVKEGI